MPRTKPFLLTLVALGGSLTIGCGSNETAPISSKSSGYEAEAATTDDARPAEATDAASEVSADAAAMQPASAPAPYAADAEEISPGLADPSEPVPDRSLQLPDSDDPEQLARFFAESDRELARLFSGDAGITDRRKLRGELLRVSQLKQEAAERLIAADAAPPELVKRAKHAKLEALSQQAGLQDARAADALQEFAAELSASDDPQLAFHSRVVRLGFAMDDLRGGREESPEPMRDLAVALAAEPELLDVPSAMAIQQALAVLAQHGHDAAASEVRGALVEATRDHRNSQLAALSSRLAGQSRFDTLRRASLAIMRGEPVAPDELEAAVDELGRTGSDAEALQFVTASGLNLEASGFDDEARTVFDALGRSPWSDAEPALAEEAEAARKAFEARQDVVGQQVEFDAADLKGVPIEWSNYRGSVVIMPFWAVKYQQSLNALPVAEEVAEQFGRDVRMLGVNLDASDQDLRDFLSQYELAFPSIRRTDAEGRGMLNPLARTAGVGSLPFVLVVDREGRVRRVVLDLRQLEAAVQELLDERAPTDAAEPPEARS